ncbi:MAG TPA: hypothetical protein VH062_01905 [Polyangiaceae bacterium]|jgi:hypothetical protein|nr:hypothetical protein [Polyangiaceae bacterium]
MPQLTEQIARDAARLRRALGGLTLCIDCGAERAIGAKECMACRRCTQCGLTGCYREVCGEDAGMEAERFDEQFGRITDASAVVLSALSVGPISIELLKERPKSAPPASSFRPEHQARIEQARAAREWRP